MTADANKIYDELMQMYEKSKKTIDEYVQILNCFFSVDEYEGHQELWDVLDESTIIYFLKVFSLKSESDDMDDLPDELTNEEAINMLQEVVDKIDQFTENNLVDIEEMDEDEIASWVDEEIWGAVDYGTENPDLDELADLAVRFREFLMQEIADADFFRVQDINEKALSEINAGVDPQIVLEAVHDCYSKIGHGLYGTSARDIDFNVSKDRAIELMNQMTESVNQAWQQDHYEYQYQGYEKPYIGIHVFQYMLDRMKGYIPEESSYEVKDEIELDEEREIFQNGGFEYALINDEMEIEITGCLIDNSWLNETLVIPEMIDEMPVTSIGRNAFFSKNISSVLLPNSLTSIAQNAFNDNQLTNVTIPNSVLKIGALAFHYNQLTSVTISNNVAEIGEGAFLDNQLTNIIIPDGVTHIGMGAFKDNYLESVMIPDSVTHIDDGAFANNNLTEVTIPASVIHIGDVAFFENHLKSIAIPSSTEYIGTFSFGNNNFDSVFITGNMLDKFDWPSIGIDPEILEVVDDEEYDISKLPLEEDHHSILEEFSTEDETEIGNFEYELIDGGTAVEITGYYDSDTSAITSLNIPANIGGKPVKNIGGFGYGLGAEYNGELGNFRFQNCKNLQVVTFPEGIEKIGDYAFQGCRSLRILKLPDRLQEIGKSSFSDCISLTELILPKNLKRIGDLVFSNCDNLRELKLPDGLQEIGMAAFLNCINLKELTLPKSLEKIGECMFSRCTNLTKVIFQGLVKEIGENVFYSCHSLSELVIPEDMFGQLDWKDSGIDINQIKVVFETEILDP